MKHPMNRRVPRIALGLLGAAVALTAYLVARSFPDMRRYARIQRM